MSFLNRLVLLALALFVIASPAFAQSMFDGKPVFSEGTDLGYYVWRDGDTWSVRWTTLGQMRSFTGSVESIGGKLKSLKRIDVESERKVLYPGRPARVWVGPRGRVHASGRRAPVVVEQKQDKIEKEGDYLIVFAARTNNDIDGFNFKVDNEATLIRFVLEIDGRRLPQRVEIGKNNLHATAIPLEAKLP
jgi:hypothetical protein